MGNAYYFFRPAVRPRSVFATWSSPRNSIAAERVLGPGGAIHSQRGEGRPNSQPGHHVQQQNQVRNVLRFRWEVTRIVFYSNKTLVTIVDRYYPINM